MKFIKYSFLFIILGWMIQGCTDLEEEAFDQLNSDIYYQDESSVKGVVARIYNEAFYGYIEYFYYLHEFSGDQVAWRIWNGGLWGYDEGHKYVLSTHTWNSQSQIIEDAWNRAWLTIGFCNNVLNDFSSINASALNMSEAQLNSYKAEVQTLRAWAYYNIFEIWGGSLPINNQVTSNIPPSADVDFDKGSKMVYDFIMEDLDASVDQLPVGSSGRMNQAMNRMLKARLLLNAEIFINEDKYDECAALNQEILNGDYGEYSLEADYRDVYGIDNMNASEVVFAFTNQVGQLEGGWMRGQPFYPYNINDYFASEQVGGWNCVILTPSKDNSASVLAGGSPQSFLDAPYNDQLGATFDRFHDKDIRKASYIYDVTTDSYSGMFLMGEMRENYGTGNVMLADADRDGEPLVYVDQVGTFKGLGKDLATVMSSRWGETNSGLRLVKYPIYPIASGKDYRNAGEVEFRLAEVYLMLAECKMRAGDADGAKALVNEVRKRYFTAADWSSVQDEPGPGFDAFDLDWMLGQWGLEYLNEGRRRRTDLRRFDKFTQGQWWFFGRANDDGVSLPAKRDRKYEWYPLPQTALSSNPGLVQVPGYE